MGSGNGYPTTFTATKATNKNVANPKASMSEKSIETKVAIEIDVERRAERSTCGLHE